MRDIAIQMANSDSVDAPFSGNGGSKPPFGDIRSVSFYHTSHHNMIYIMLVILFFHPYRQYLITLSVIFILKG